jgi:hypothetical protein
MGAPSGLKSNKNKRMKKILKYLAIIIGILIVILIVAPFLFKDQIVSKIKQEANKQLNAMINFDNNISLSFFRHFPNASLGVKDLTIIGKNRFDGDTLAAVDHLQIVIDLTSLFGNKTYQIRNVVLDRPYIQLLVDSAGNANWDIMKEDSTAAVTSETSSFKAALQQYAIHDGRLVFSDTSNNFYMKVTGLDHSGKGDFTKDIFDLNTTSHAKALTIAYGGIPYLNQIVTDLDADINVDVPHAKYTFKKNTIKLNGLALGVDGYVAMPDSNNITMDLSLTAAKADFKNFLSLIPAIYQKNFDKLKASGKMMLSGFVKGIYNDKRIPAFGIQLKVDNGMFQYPSVPEPLSDVNLDLSVKNDDGNVDHTLIDVRQLHFRMGNNPFDAHLIVQNPQSDPLVDGAVKGKLNLAEISKIYPLEQGTKLDGMLDMDVQAKGRLSAVEHKKYDQFDARGRVMAGNIVYQSSSLQQGVRIPQGQLTFSPQQVKVSNVKAEIGKSDIAANGGLDNLFGYLFGKEKLKGSLEIQSRLLDLNEMMGADTVKTADTTSGKVRAVIIPKNIDFALQTEVGRFIYDNYDLTHVKGSVRVADGILTIKNISTDMLDGSAQLSGAYNTQNPKIPKTNMSLKVNNIDIQKAFKTFNTVQALAPVAAFVQGNFSGNIDLSTLLDEKLFPRLMSLNSVGNISIPNLNISGFTPMQQLASNLGIQQLKNMDIRKLLLHFKIDSGFMKVKPFGFAVDGIKMNVEGKNGLNKAIDYTIHMNIPRDKLGNANTTLTDLLAKANAATNSQVNLGDSIAIGVSLGGTINKPQISLDLSEEKSRVENALKSAAEEKLKEGAGKLLDQALKKDSARTDTVKKGQPAKEQIKNAVEKGLKGLFNKKEQKK